MSVPPRRNWQTPAKAFDSNNDGKLSAGDAKFADFRIWRDTDGDGAVDQGEVLTLSAIGFQSMSLSGTANNSTVTPGDVAIVNTGSWTRTNGITAQFADAAMTFFSTAEAPLAPITDTTESFGKKRAAYQLVAAGGTLTVQRR